MKNVLLSTSAVVLVAMASAPAAAAEWEISLGGYMEQFIVYGSSDSPAGTDFDGVDVQSDTEIIFTPSITLDNGIKFSANIQLEGNTSGDHIDESFVSIKGSFGEILIGSENSAGYKTQYAAPDATFFGINSGSSTGIIPSNTGDGFFRSTLGSTFLENNGTANNDAMRITYFTPRFAGFQLGVSYARDGTQDDNIRDNCSAAGVTCDYFDIGTNYVQSFGDFSVAASARWGIASTGGAAATDPQVYGFGVNLGYAGFTIGGSFAEQNGTADNDGTAYDIGASYETGPWAFSVTYFHGENHDNDNPNATSGGSSANDETFDQVLVGINYKLAKGVRLNGFGGYVDFDEDARNTTDADGFFIGTGIRLDF